MDPKSVPQLTLTHFRCECGAGGGGGSYDARAVLALARRPVPNPATINLSLKRCRCWRPWSPLRSCSRTARWTLYLRALSVSATLVRCHVAPTGGRWRRRARACPGAAGAGAAVVQVGRQYFNEDNGRDVLKEHAATPSFDDEHIKRGYLALAAAVRNGKRRGPLSATPQLMSRGLVDTQAALTKYVEYVQSVMIAPKSLQVCWRGTPAHPLCDGPMHSDAAPRPLAELGGHVTVDWHALRHLEVLRNNATGSEKLSLFGVINRTKAEFGAAVRP